MKSDQFEEVTNKYLTSYLKETVGEKKLDCEKALLGMVVQIVITLDLTLGKKAATKAIIDFLRHLVRERLPMFALSPEDSRIRH